jgi:hypothetical protein
MADLHMAAPSDNRNDSRDVLMGAGILLATCVVFCLGLLLICFATLRENKVFWTNAGGYPIWLRDMVQWTYVPLMLLAILALFVLSMACCSKIYKSIRFFVLESLLLLMCWGLVTTSGCIAFNNNIKNLIQGRDLHEHPE